ncbi:hypothetical protein GGI42DRAFT_36574 [Trichoderma sp. SZMC 28013]
MGVENRLSENKEGKHLWSQIQKISLQTRHAQNNGPIKFEILFRSSDRSIKFAESFRDVLLGRALSNLHQSLLLRCLKHSPEARILLLGICPGPADVGFPTDPQGTRTYHFAAAHQHLLYNVAGSYYDEYAQWGEVEKLSSTTYAAAILPLPHVQNDRHFLCILDCKGQDVTLPKHGESCKDLFSSSNSSASCCYRKCWHQTFQCLELLPN